MSKSGHSAPFLFDLKEQEHQLRKGGDTMVERKFVGEQSLTELLFPYLESELKKRLANLQTSGQEDYNKDTPTFTYAAAPHEEVA